MNSSFIVEGCVGVGKSALMTALAKSHPSWLVLPEPVYQWERADLHGSGPTVNLLQEFYTNPNTENIRTLQVS